MIRFLTTRNVSAVDIHCQSCEAYGSNANAMSDSKVRYWLGQFKDGCENVHDESRSGQPYLITNCLITAVDLKVCAAEDSR